MVPQDSGDGHPASSLPALGWYLALQHVPATFHADHTHTQVDVVSTEPDKLAATQAGVESGGPQRAFVRLKRSDHRLCLVGRDDAPGAVSNRGLLDPNRGIDVGVAASDGTA